MLLLFRNLIVNIYDERTLKKISEEDKENFGQILNNIKNYLIGHFISFIEEISLLPPDTSLSIKIDYFLIYISKCF